jgi:hypothetical protein
MLGGQLTLAELEDFLALCEFRMGQIADAYAKVVPSWVAKDPNAFIDWSTDWSTLQDRYREAAAKAKVAIEAAELPFLVTATELYTAVARSMKQAYPDGPVRKGDWAELRTRLAQVTPIPDGEPPKPKAINADNFDSFELAEMIARTKVAP